MDGQILYLTLAALAFGIALNLKLTLSVLRASRRERHVAEGLVPGQPVPPVTARTLTRDRVQLVGNGQSSVLLFLSSKCPKCRSKLPELEQMLTAARQEGLAIWLVSEEPAWRLRGFLRGYALLSVAARVKLKDYMALNATLLSPAYFFVNHDGMLEATGLIGDENWLGLRAQLSEGGALLEAAA
jgi:peroxiredoxin